MAQPSSMTLKFSSNGSYFSSVKSTLEVIRRIPWFSERLACLDGLFHEPEVCTMAESLAFLLNPENQTNLDLDPLSCSTGKDFMISEEMLVFLQYCTINLRATYKWDKENPKAYVLQHFRKVFIGLSNAEKDKFFAGVIWELIEWLTSRFKEPFYCKDGLFDCTSVVHLHITPTVHRAFSDCALGELIKMTNEKTELAIFSFTFDDADSLIKMPVEMPGSKLQLYRDVHFETTNCIKASIYIYALDNKWFESPLNFEKQWRKVTKVHLTFVLIGIIRYLILLLLFLLKYPPFKNVKNLVFRGYIQWCVFICFFFIFYNFHMCILATKASSFYWPVWLGMMGLALANSTFCLRSIFLACKSIVWNGMGGEILFTNLDDSGIEETFRVPLKSLQAIVFFVYCGWSAVYFPLLYIMIKFTFLQRWFFYTIPRS